MERGLNTTSNLTEDDDDCADITAVAYTRRYYDLVCAYAGFVLSLFHLIILIYIRFWQKHKGFFLLLVQAALSLFTMFLLIIGSFIDICTIELNTVWTFFRVVV